LKGHVSFIQLFFVNFSCWDSSSSNLGSVVLINFKMVKLWLDVATCEGVNEPTINFHFKFKGGTMVP
jgi:hypothetical protein